MQRLRNLSLLFLLLSLGLAHFVSRANPCQQPSGGCNEVTGCPDELCGCNFDGVCNPIHLTFAQ
jgi:hypothetical protein